MTPLIGRKWASAAAGILLACAGLPATAQPPANLAAVPDATIVAEHWLTSRTVQITVSTNAFTAPVAVEVMLPRGYRPDDGQRWPVTYYLAGANHDQTALRAAYDGEAVTESYPSIVVEPRGDIGFWSDWFDQGRGGPPKYESFVIGQLIPLIDANFRTIPDRAHRAIVGESMGGYGTFMLAARHPDRFVAAASLSGVLDTNSPQTWDPVSYTPIAQGAAPAAVYGPRATEEIRWRGHNPPDLAENLRAVDLQVFTGNGVYDPAHGESAGEQSVGCPVESALVHQPSVSMHTVLLALDIPHGWTDLPWGCHGAALFEYEMRQAIRHLAEVFASPPAAPSSFDFRSIEPSFDVWGWSVRADPNRAMEFLDLRDVSDTGLSVTGSGTTSITTPPLFRGADQVRVTVDGSPMTVSPNAEGEVTLVLDLGPADRQQQYRPGAVTEMRTAVVQLVR
ncbi:alpha/beta hydrolase [Nocardia jejuensis]|uniref:alpha/beta hydrolase n=1 Tax=Nocardia jejuensis TaxID=328049 RepID=UPI0008363504|nr:alpha/beta hydrolase family protein [Nocardia jejuensis]